MEFKGNLKSVLSTELAGYLVDTGSTNAYAVALRPAITTYTTGLRITFQAANGNTSTSTLAVNGLAAKTIKKNVSTDLTTGDILTNQIVTVTYDGTNFQMAAAAGGGAGSSGYSGYCGLSGYSGFCGLSGYSGYSGSGLSGYSGYCGLSGYSGFCGLSGYSGFSGTIVAYTATFNATTDWGSASGGLYTITFTHNLNSSNLLIEIWDTTSTPTLVNVEQVLQVNVNNLSISVSDSPDERFQGHIIINGSAASGFSGYCGLSGYSGFSGANPGASGYSGYSGTNPGSSGYSGFCGLSGYSGFCGLSGYSGYSGSGVSGYSGYSGSGTSGYSGYSGPVPKVLLTYNSDLGVVAGTIISKSGTITGTAGVGSSLFLHRLNIPGTLNLTEIDAAMSIGFPATSQGAGTMSRSMAVYSFGNSTSLALVASASNTSAWSTGTSTTAGAVSLTQFQGGWSSPLIQPMTFAATSFSAGEYVIGQIFDFAQGSSTWTLNFYGEFAQSTALASAATNLTSATLGALSSGGFSSVSAITGITQNATNNVSWFVSRATSAVTSVASATSSFTFVEAPFVGSLLTVGGSFHSATATLGAVTNVALGALSSTTLVQSTLPNFGFIGTGSTTSGFPTHFLNGIMSTGALPANITLTSTAVTYSGSIAFQQPWFALLGT